MKTGEMMFYFYMGVVVGLLFFGGLQCEKYRLVSTGIEKTMQINECAKLGD